MENHEVLGFNPSSSLPWLNSITQVDLLLREFTSDVLHKFANQVDRPAYMTWLDVRLMELNDLFLGFQNTADTRWGYQRGTWNTPQQLGAYLQLNASVVIDDAAYAVRDVCMAYVFNVLTLTNVHIDEDLALWGDELNRLTEYLVCDLLGLTHSKLPT
jgi:hypothetical protein